MLHALSFDIEDWFHMVEIDAVADTSRWPSLVSIVERETDWILRTLAEHKTRATFFVLGWVAHRYPSLVQRIHQAGHELGTHSHWHRKVYELDRRTFRDDVAQSIEAIAGPTGAAVTGFRAPSFSIVPGCEWAFEVLAELGVRYDASLFPARRGHGGYPCRQGPHRFNHPPIAGGMPELPMSVAQFGPMRLAFSGGGYLRALPLPIIHAGFRQLERRGQPAVVYLHPRDFAPDCPRVPMSLKRRFKCYVGLGTTRRKLTALLQRYRFTTCADVLKAHALIE